jgi:hypothetical protein
MFTQKKDEERRSRHTNKINQAFKKKKRIVKCRDPDSAEAFLVIGGLTKIHKK